MDREIIIDLIAALSGIEVFFAFFYVVWGVSNLQADDNALNTKLKFVLWLIGIFIPLKVWWLIGKGIVWIIEKIATTFERLD